MPAFSTESAGPPELGYGPNLLRTLGIDGPNTPSKGFVRPGSVKAQGPPKKQYLAIDGKRLLLLHWDSKIESYSVCGPAHTDVRTQTHR